MDIAVYLRKLRWLAVTAITITGILLGILARIASQSLSKSQDVLLQYASTIIGSAGDLIGVIAVLAFLNEQFSLFRVFREFSYDLTERLRKLIIEDLIGIQKLGLKGVRQKIKLDELLKNLKSEDELYALVTYLTADVSKPLKHAVKEAVRSGAHLRFLIMNPKSRLLKLRADELLEHDINRAGFKSGVKNFHQELIKLQEEITRKKYKGTLKIALYDDLIGSPVCLIKKDGKPEIAYCGFYFREPIDRGKVPYFEWGDSGQGSFIRQIDSYVREKWDRFAKEKGKQKRGENVPQLQDGPASKAQER